MSGQFTIKSTNQLLKERQLEAGGGVQVFIDSEVLRRCSPKVPLDSGILNRSGTDNTQLGSGLVKYKTPYARHRYYEPANFTGAPERGNYWFLRMIRNGGREAILRGVEKLSGGRSR